MGKVFESWQNADRQSRRLAGKIAGSGFRPEILVAITRGGLFPALIISHELENRELYAVKCTHYDSKGCMMSAPSLQQKLPEGICAGKKVLLIDEVADSGESLEMIGKALKRQKPKEVKTAVLHFKLSSRHRPDFFAKKTGEWIVYPWEKKSLKKSKSH